MLQCIEFNMHHITIDLYCIEFDMLLDLMLLYPDPPALHLVCTSEEHVRHKINTLRQEAKFNDVLRLDRLPPRGQQQEQQEQQVPPAPTSGPSSSTSAEGSRPTPEEEARNVTGKKILDATYRPINKVQGDTPPHIPGLRGVDIGFNQEYGYQSMEGITHLIDYGAINGGFVPLTTQQHGACMFHTFRWCISCPQEFTNSHLRHMLVSFICSRAEELYPMLVCSISGNYRHIWLSPEEYRRKQASDQLTEQERQEFNEPGPLSIVSYCEAILKSDFYGEELCLRFLSMMFKVHITVLDGDSLVGIRVRHQNAAPKADVILVHVNRCHYITMGEPSFITFFLL